MFVLCTYKHFISVGFMNLNIQTFSRHYLLIQHVDVFSTISKQSQIKDVVLTWRVLSKLK